ncbi:MAG: NFACT family protein [Clostridia bacterium]|nr:NFACT family protein [Clostridia bacterium]
MPQDALMLKYLCEELNTVFSGGKINRIVEPNVDQTVFTVFNGKKTYKLLIDVNPSMPRISVTEREGESPLTAPNFCMLLRKHLLNATIDKIAIVPFDRIVKIDITPSSEYFDDKPKVLFVELMGRYSNIILTEDGKILGGNRGINMFDNGIRPLIVGKEYVFPPTNNKLIYSDEKIIGLLEKAEDYGAEEYGNYLASVVSGLSVLTAKEIVERYIESGKDVKNAKDFFIFLNGFIEKTEPQPNVVKNNGEIKDICAFNYKTIDGEREYFNSLYTAEDVFFTEKSKEKEYRGLKDRLNAICNTNLKKQKKKLSSLKTKEKDGQKAEENRLKGELIIANIYKIKRGDKEITVDNYYDGTTLKIELDERLSPAENSQAYYKKYNKQKRTLDAVGPQIAEAENQCAYIESLLSFISFCDDKEDLIEIKKELETVGFIKSFVQSKTKKTATAQYRAYSVEGYTVKVGRNNAENDKLCFSAKPTDLWLHAKEYHSSHVIIENDNGVIPDKVLKVGAEICAYYSAGRDGGKVEIAYTERKNVKKPPKSPLGFFIYNSYKSVLVSPDKHENLLKGLFNAHK